MSEVRFLLKRHNFYYKLFRPLVVLFLKIRFGYKFQYAKNLPDNYIVLSNHTTDYDMLFVGASFKKQMYFVGSEHIARWKTLYKFIKHAFAPIMRLKGASATSAILDIKRKTKKGANVCMFPEGVRSWDGRTCPILESTAQLVKSAGCGLVTYRIQGGYFASPMWGGASVRRGRVYGAPVRVFTKEQLAQMTPEEIYEVIKTDLWEDAYERQERSPEKYKSKTAAEHLENLLFVCPYCQSKDGISSSKDKVSCSHCGNSFTYNQYGMLEGAPYTTVRELSDWQKKCIEHDVENNTEYSASNAKLISVIKHQETPVTEGKLIITPLFLKCGNTEFPLSDITDLAMHGQHAVVFTVGKQYYELNVNKGENALKFMLYYNQAIKQKNGVQ